MKNLHKKITVIACFVILAMLGLFSLVLPKKDFSETENRFLAEWPEVSGETLWSGETAADVSGYLTDHFALRDAFIGLNTACRRLTLKNSAGGILFASDGYYIEEYAPMERPDLIYRSINAFAENNPTVKVQVMLVPTATSVLSDKLPAIARTDAQMADYATIRENLRCEVIDVTDVLAATDYAFYRLDHHWTTRAAYGAYVRFCEANGLIAHPVSDYTVTAVADDFCGTVYNKTIPLFPQKDRVEVYTLADAAPVTVTYGGATYASLYAPEKLLTADKYAYFLNGNHPLTVIKSEAADATGHLLIIKDSYANCFVPFLTDHYKTITLVDPRYYGKSIHDYIAENGVDAVLFLYNLNTIGTDIGIRGIE